MSMSPHYCTIHTVHLFTPPLSLLVWAITTLTVIFIFYTFSLLSFGMRKSPLNCASYTVHCTQYLVFILLPCLLPTLPSGISQSPLNCTIYIVQFPPSPLWHVQEPSSLYYLYFKHAYFPSPLCRVHRNGHTDTNTDMVISIPIHPSRIYMKPIPIPISVLKFITYRYRYQYRLLSVRYLSSLLLCHHKFTSLYPRLSPNYPLVLIGSVLCPVPCPVHAVPCSIMQQYALQGVGWAQ